MVIDTSALIAILEQEPQAGALALAIQEDCTRLLCAASLLEASIVMAARRGEVACRELDLLVYRAGIEVSPVTREQAEIGRQAFLSYGKGRHPASLNYGDCFVYALSATSGEPILATGDDFGRTDAAVVTV
ncbi:MAG: type II toxin-antitoxin system VapC family toxin [Candidatus Riflebacteria bacterium]|nr:type II toxin-antitoxin system VapC family toxin [Candidatus Riflebacteria bacterium]